MKGTDYALLALGTHIFDFDKLNDMTINEDGFEGSALQKILASKIVADKGKELENEEKLASNRHSRRVGKAKLRKNKNK